VCRAIPPELDDIVLRAMSRRIEARYPTVAALGRALLPHADESPRARWVADLGEPGAAPPINPTLVDVRESRARPVARRTLAKRATLAAAALCAAAALIVGLGVRRATRDAAITLRRHPSPAPISASSAVEATIVPTRPREEAAPAAVLQGNTPHRPSQTASPSPTRPRQPNRWRARPEPRSTVSPVSKATEQRAGRPTVIGAGAASQAIGDDDAIDPNASLE